MQPVRRAFLQFLRPAPWFRLRPVVASVAVAAVLAAGVLVQFLPAPDGRRAAAETRVLLRERLARAPVRAGDVQDYRGPGSWIDIYDESWANPTRAVKRIAERGYRTLYLETSNYRRPTAFAYREKTEEFLDAAERFGVATVAWYLPGLRDVEKDYRRSVAAIRLETVEGNRFDSFALDIESSEVRNPDKRTARVLRLSEKLRAYTDTETPEGPTYPLGGIIPSPRNMDLSSSYWPRFPYRELMSVYDVLVPMSYFSYQAHGPAQVHAYMQRCFKVLRSESGIATFPVHMIGGIADDTSETETRAYTRSVREFGGIGGSYYTFPLTKGTHHAHLRSIPVNQPQDPALPVGFGYDAAIGNVPGADETHPKEVFYATDGKRGRWRLAYRAFDVQNTEVAILVNWRKIGTVPTGPDDAWSAPRMVAIGGKYLHDRGRNTIAFVAQGAFPEWNEWGVRDTSLRKI
ncbi:MAG: hypothetical protein WEA54_06155 [Actinomycetota bacterium]